MKLDLYSSMLSGFSLFHINSQHELQWKKKETIFVQDNLSEVVKSWASLVTEK